MMHLYQNIIIMVTSQFYTLEFIYAVLKKTLEKNEGTIKNGQSRETGSIGYTRREKNKTYRQLTK
jgi:hypothetical protein